MQETPDHQAPRPGLRRGPRPLMLHLVLAALKSSNSPDAWPSSKESWQSLIEQIANQGPAAAAKQPFGPDPELIRGIAAYRRHPWVRDVTDPPSVWQEGGARLLDYGGAGPAPPLLLVPSLINRATILDLSQSRSMARYLASRGLRVLLLDWGWPGDAERAIDLDGLITGRLSRAIAASGPEVTVVGYCMGGLLALAAAQLGPSSMAGLALLATPWDFHAGRADAEVGVAKLLETVEPIMQLSGTLPIDALQLLFSVGDPHGVGDKYRLFGAAPQDSERARQFVAIEDWLNDGVPLAAPVARQCLRDWYGANAPVRGQWRVAGEVIDPSRLSMPVFIAVPGRDRIVPPDSAMPLAALIPAAEVVRPAAGHVGMIAGATARHALWDRLAAWALAVRPASPGFRKRGRKAKVAG